MQRRFIAGVALAAALAAAGVTAQNAPDPADAIAARRALMTEIDRLMRPFDAFAFGEPADTAALRADAGTLAAMLAATPHLFPPESNRFDPDAELPVTLALPSIWTEFDAFYAFAGTAAEAANAAAAAADDDALRDAAVRLRGACDGCHAAYLREYVPAGVSSEDLEFDFESVLPQN